MLFEATSTRFIRAALIGLLLVGALGVMAMHIIRSDRGPRLARLELTEARLDGEIARMKRINARLWQDLDLMENSTIGWQEAARREHGMVLPGELVIRFPAE